MPSNRGIISPADRSRLHAGSTSASASASGLGRALPSTAGRVYEVDVRELLADAVALSAAQQSLKRAQCRRRDTERLLEQARLFLAIFPLVVSSWVHCASSNVLCLGCERSRLQHFRIQVCSCAGCSVRVLEAVRTLCCTARLWAMPACAWAR